ncbi:uncharacterized protein DS421_20g693840 [Arachis hypogaea]|nr:uncharacterized protein DS421_20g693840 [Arachis hypogaea]
MWNVIIPNSPGYDDDVVIDENISTQPLVIGVRHMTLQSGTMMRWGVGTPKLSLGGNTTHPYIEQRSTDKVVVCEVFSHSATPLLPLSNQPHHLIATVEVTNQIQPESAKKSITRPSQGRTRVKHPELISRLDSPIFLIPMSHEMVFDPTADMDLIEVLFKFYELEVVRGMFHSLIPKFVPYSNIVNIVVMFASLRASRATPICFWFLPSPFAIDVIVKKHLCQWNHLWYIMVVYVKQGKVYSLDITKTDENMQRREHNMRTIQEQNAGSFTEISPYPTS